MTTISFIGSGNIGSTVAQLAVDAGYDVVLSNSRGPETLAELVEKLGPKARAATSTEAAEAGDLVVFTIPLGKIEQVDPATLAGKVVIDTCNYYPQRDGDIAALDDKQTTTTGLVQQHLAQSHVVKAFNNISRRWGARPERPTAAR
jgi:predicted dinucleotide-binding enzyme